MARSTVVTGRHRTTSSLAFTPLRDRQKRLETALSMKQCTNRTFYLGEYRLEQMAAPEGAQVAAAGAGDHFSPHAHTDSRSSISIVPHGPLQFVFVRKERPQSLLPPCEPHTSRIETGAQPPSPPRPPAPPAENALEKTNDSKMQEQFVASFSIPKVI